MSRHGRKIGPSICSNDCCEERSTVEGEVATSTLIAGWLGAVSGGVRSSLEQARSLELSSADFQVCIRYSRERRCLECRLETSLLKTRTSFRAHRFKEQQSNARSYMNDPTCASTLSSCWLSHFSRLRCSISENLLPGCDGFQWPEDNQTCAWLPLLMLRFSSGAITALQRRAPID